MKGLIAEIYKGRYQAANGGLSERCDQVVIVGPGIAEIFEANPDRPAVRLVKGHTPGTARIIPVDQPAGMCGPMSGGSFVASCDSRFREAVEAIVGGPFYGAVPLHDRFEA